MQQLSLFPSKQEKELEKPSFIKVASWNVNSIRSRREQINAWLKRESPDIVCLQETKVKDENFPIQDFVSLGYNVAVHGEQKYNGVAILSRFSIEEIIKGFEGSPDNSARVISVRVLGIKFFSVYAPNAKFKEDYSMVQKMRWYKQFTEYLKKNHSRDEPLLLCGDFNVVAQDFETFNPKHWLCTTMVDIESRDAFSNLLRYGLSDIMRTGNPDLPLYTWWDYGNGLETNRGMRLDYFLSTKKLGENILESKVDYVTRKIEKSSDHAPIICKIQLR